VQLLRVFIDRVDVIGAVDGKEPDEMAVKLNEDHVREGAFSSVLSG